MRTIKRTRSWQAGYRAGHKAGEQAGRISERSSCTLLLADEHKKMEARYADAKLKRLEASEHVLRSLGQIAEAAAHFVAEMPRN